MKYLSLCSGIEAASVAWEPLGWKPVAFAEIDAFPSAVLAHHYPDVPNLGDMTSIESGKFSGQIDVIIGGTPCQSYSVAGQRRGLDDERGALSLHYARLINEINPKYFIWENVPGVLSDKGNAYGHFLAKLTEQDVPLEPAGGKWAGAGWVLIDKWSLAWRILDAQYFGVPQRRRRIFLVGCIRSVGDAREILFEREGVSWYPEKSRETGQENPREIRRGFAGAVGFNEDGFSKYRRSGVVGCLRASGGSNGAGSECLVLDEKSKFKSHWEGGHIHPTLCISGGHGGPGISNQDVFGQKGACLVQHVYENHGQDSRIKEVDLCPSVVAKYGTGGNNIPLVQKVHNCIQANSIRPNHLHGGNGLGISDGKVSPTLTTNDIHAIHTNKTVRRLTPVECERLQGFPDNWTQVPYRNKPSTDTPRYKAIGNSMAVPVIKWLGERIQAYDKDNWLEDL